MSRFVPLLIVNVVSTAASVVLFLEDHTLAASGFLFVAAVTAISVPAQMGNPTRTDRTVRNSWNRPQP